MFRHAPHKPNRHLAKFCLHRSDAVLELLKIYATPVATHMTDRVLGLSFSQFEISNIGRRNSERSSKLFFVAVGHFAHLGKSFSHICITLRLRHDSLLSCRLDELRIDTARRDKTCKINLVNLKSKAKSHYSNRTLPSKKKTRWGAEL